jgi:hypothetical protein
LDAVFANDRKQMIDANEHIGFLVHGNGWDSCSGKGEIATAIYNFVTERV